ncbi:MAG: hypothetical protein WA594_04595, partial [Candidatus Sulfotelmatobacter sp.]
HPFAAPERPVTPDSKLPVENSPAPSPTPTEDSTWLLNSPSSSPVHQAHTGLQLWLHRTSVFLFVLISAIAGVLLLILPWTPEWTDNYLLLSYPWLRTLISTGFFRGLCSGLGLLDIWIGFWEALHYHDRQ